MKGWRVIEFDYNLASDISHKYSSDDDVLELIVRYKDLHDAYQEILNEKEELERKLNVCENTVRQYQQEVGQ